MTVRVRFAPSPTGFLHIGNARAALINWLYAKSHGGLFMLRLDDTDQRRSEERYAEAIIEDLKWLGLTYQEFARQSDRFDCYLRVKEDLIQEGRLYPCYETAEELDFKRRRQLSKGLPPLYDRASLQLTDSQKSAFEAQGRNPHWRFKLSAEPVSWRDLVRGPVEFQADRLSDPVLVREDGAFLYTFTSVVDDVDFSITHVLRGEDHVTNTAVQIQLFQALSQDSVPQFAHTTLLMDEKGQALSKRLGSLSLRNLRERGIDPMAINSLLARLGTSLPIEPLLELEQLAKGFNLDTFSRTPPRFDEQELFVLNHKLYKVSPFSFVEDRLKEQGLFGVDKPLWDAIRGNIQTLQDVVLWEKIFKDPLFVKTGFSPEEIVYLTIAAEHLPSSPWSGETWKEWTEALKTLTHKKGKDLFMPLRKAITGEDHGPEMKDLLLLMGESLVKKRLLGASV